MCVCVCACVYPGSSVHYVDEITPRVGLHHGGHHLLIFLTTTREPRQRLAAPTHCSLHTHTSPRTFILFANELKEGVCVCVCVCVCLLGLGARWICKLVFYLLWQMLWPLFGSHRFPAISSNHNCSSDMGHVWYDDCTDERHIGAILWIQPRWLSLMWSGLLNQLTRQYQMNRMDGFPLGKGSIFALKSFCWSIRCAVHWSKDLVKVSFRLSATPYVSLLWLVVRLSRVLLVCACWWRP